MTSADYTSAKSFLEFSYGHGIGLVDTSQSPWSFYANCAVTSAIVTRRQINVQFTASVSEAKSSVARANANSLDSAALTTAMNAVKTGVTTYSSQNVPTVNTVNTPTIQDNSGGTTSSVGTVGVDYFYILIVGVITVALHQY